MDAEHTELLRKYMSLVRLNEGTAFVTREDDARLCGITHDEWELLNQIEDELVEKERSGCRCLTFKGKRVMNDDCPVKHQNDLIVEP